MSVPVPHKYCHMFTPIRFFAQASESRIHFHHNHHCRSPVRELLQLLSLFKSLHQEMADNYMKFLTKLGNISSRVTVMEGQSPPTVQTGITTSLVSTQLSSNPTMFTMTALHTTGEIATRMNSLIMMRRYIGSLNQTQRTGIPHLYQLKWQRSFLPLSEA